MACRWMLVTTGIDDMAQRGMMIEVRFYPAWWVRWYLAGVVIMARVTGLDPDLDRVAAWPRRLDSTGGGG